MKIRLKVIAVVGKIRHLTVAHFSEGLRPSGCDVNEAVCILPLHNSPYRGGPAGWGWAARALGGVSRI